MAIDKTKLTEIIKKRFGTSDEDLEDLGTIMDALDGLEKAEYLENQIVTERAENEKKLKDLDNEWRTRYRERFFSGDSDVSDLIDKMENDSEEDLESEEITIEDYLKNFNEKGEYKHG